MPGIAGAVETGSLVGPKLQQNINNRQNVLENICFLMHLTIFFTILRSVHLHEPVTIHFLPIFNTLTP